MIIKRLFDIILSLFGIIFFSPIMLIIAFLIKFSKYSDRGPVIFKQERVGLGQKLFFIHKFRTMVINSPALGETISCSNDPRITRLGKFLRKTKLDELPQLFDVLIGKMSFVGPRPEVPEYVALYDEEVKKIIFSVRPGITDWASILIMIDEGEILAGVDDKKLYYVQKIMPQKLLFAVNYVKNRNFIKDLSILFSTVLSIIKPIRFYNKINN